MFGHHAACHMLIWSPWRCWTLILKKLLKAVKGCALKQKQTCCTLAVPPSLCWDKVCGPLPWPCCYPSSLFGWYQLCDFCQQPTRSLFYSLFLCFVISWRSISVETNSHCFVFLYPVVTSGWTNTRDTATKVEWSYEVIWSELLVKCQIKTTDKDRRVDLLLPCTEEQNHTCIFGRNVKTMTFCCC